MLTIGFNGQQFKGSHYLDESEGRTVERELEKALVASKVIEPSKLQMLNKRDSKQVLE